PEVTADLVRRSDPLGGAPFHIALELDGAMLAGEVDVVLPDALVAAQRMVLADPPIQVRAAEVRIKRGSRERDLPVPRFGNPRPHSIEVPEQPPCFRGEGGGRAARVG